MRKEPIIGVITFFLYSFIELSVGLSRNMSIVILGFTGLMLIVGLLPTKYYNKLKSKRNQEEG